MGMSGEPEEEHGRLGLVSSWSTRRRSVLAGCGSGLQDEEAERAAQLRLGLERNLLQLTNAVRISQNENAALKAKVQAKDETIAGLTASLWNVRHASSKRKGTRGAAQCQIPAHAGDGGGEQPESHDRLDPSKGGMSNQKQDQGRDQGQEQISPAQLVAEGREQSLRLQDLQGLIRSLRQELVQAHREAEVARGRTSVCQQQCAAMEADKNAWQARVTDLREELQLQAAPLKGLQLELERVRAEAETVRQRLMDERKQARLRYEASEAGRLKEHTRARDLEIELRSAQRDSEHDHWIRATVEAERKAGAKRALEELSSKGEEISRLERELAIAQKQCLKHEADEATDIKHQADGVKDMGRDASAALLPNSEAWAARLEGELQPTTVPARPASGRVRNSNPPAVEHLRELTNLQAAVKTLEAKVFDLTGQLDEACTARAQAERAMQQRSMDEEKVKLSCQEELGKMEAAANASQEVLRAQLAQAQRHAEEAHAHTNALLRESEKEAARARSRETAGQEAMGRLAKLERELCVCVEKLLAAEEASEATYTCLVCMSPFSKGCPPYSLVPCGHSICKECLLKEGANRRGPASEAVGICSQCTYGQNNGGTPSTAQASQIGGPGLLAAPNRALSTLCAKYAYRKLLLTNLKDMSLAVKSSHGT